MPLARKPVKISALKHTQDALVLVFDDGKEFVYPAELLRAALPADDDTAQRVREVLQ
jgi:DUF971 family protein